MSTCKDCLHFEVCAYFKEDLPCCADFKDSTKWVERPKGRWTATDIVSKKAGYGVRYYNHAECEVAPCRLFEDMHDFCPACGDDMRGESE